MFFTMTSGTMVRIRSCCVEESAQVQQRPQAERRAIDNLVQSSGRFGHPLRDETTGAVREHDDVVNIAAKLVPSLDSEPPPVQRMKRIGYLYLR